MKRTTILTVFAFAAVLAACSSKKTTTTSTNETNETNGDALFMQAAAAKFPGYTKEEFSKGKTMYEANCGMCHGLKKPTSQNEDGWRHWVPDMAKKVNKKSGSEVLTAADNETIIRYLVVSANMK
jgi:cytochrome c5